MQRGPFIDVPVGFTQAAKPYSAFIEKQAVPFSIQSDDALFHTVENDLHQIDSIQQLVDSALQAAPGLSMSAFPLAQRESRQEVQV